jgi:RNA polymerase sigma-70 factor (ECF subfamily)
VEAALREVPEAYRTVVVLREIEGFAYEEIAEILNVNIGTVKSRLTRGRSALRTLLVGDVAKENSASSTARAPSNLETGRCPETVTQ